MPLSILEGEVIFSHPDGDHAVTRSFDAWGDPQYQMISRTGAIPDAKKIAELKEAITQDRLKDKFEYQKNQEGPWNGKTDSVVGTKSVDPAEDIGLVGSCATTNRHGCDESRPCASTRCAWEMLRLRLD